MKEREEGRMKGVGWVGNKSLCFQDKVKNQRKEIIFHVIK